MSFARFALAGVLSLAALPAHADWQWSEWGMSPEEAYSASGGVAIPFKPEAGDVYNDNGTLYHPRARFNTEMSGHLVSVDMLFNDSDELEVVMINPGQGVACEDLEAAVTADLGDPEYPVEPSDFVRIMVWDDGENAVQLTSTPSIGLCNLSYRSL